MANTAQNAPKFQIGKLSAEDAERLATSFRPAWELDDAPFAQANGLSPADIDALAGGAGIAPSVRNALEPAAPAPATFELKTAAQATVPAEPIDVEVDIEPDVAPQIAQARPQAASTSTAPTSRRPYTPPKPPPRAVNMRDVDSGEYAPVKKSNTGLIIGVVAVLGLGGAIFGIRALMSDSKTATTAPTATTATHEETHIPPPPDTVATQPPVQQAATQAPTQTAAAPTTKPVETTAPAPTHAVVTNVVAPVHTAASGGTHAGGHAAGGAPTHHPTIVRDNPF